MSPNQGKFVWYELLTHDTRIAATFYQKLVGWTAQEITPEGGGADCLYTLLHLGDSQIAGAMAIPEEARVRGVPPCWTGYIWVEDVDVTAARIIAAGGTIHRPGEDIPGVGRFAVAADPQGAVFVIFRDVSGPPTPPPAPGTPGQFTWHELHADNQQTVFPFYADLFGWEKGPVVDMGPLGPYQIVTHNGVPIGGILNRIPAIPRAFWLYYLGVEALDAALTRLREAGGHVLAGPHQVPGGNWVAQCLDPQGAFFALISPTL